MSQFFKCVIKEIVESWISVGKIYQGETVVFPEEFSGDKFIYIKKADDGFPAYVPKKRFIPMHTIGYKEEDGNPDI